VHQVRPRHAHDPERRALRRPLRPHAGLRSGDRHRRLHEDQHPGRRLGRRAGPARPWYVSFLTVLLRVSSSEGRVRATRLRSRLARHSHAYAIADARADGRGNPIGGVVYGNTFGAAQQYHEWTSFISDSEFCFRACVGPNAHINCQHIYDGTSTLQPSHSLLILTSPTVMGCYWNMPANYDSGYYESCKADDDLPMGVYGASTWFVPFVRLFRFLAMSLLLRTSGRLPSCCRRPIPPGLRVRTWSHAYLPLVHRYQGQNPTPSAHPVAASSQCTAFPSVTVSPARRSYPRAAAAGAYEPLITPPPRA
jgi:hypothetical protein